MEEKKKRFPLSIYEIILLVILIPIIFYHLEKFLWTFEASDKVWWSSWFIYCLRHLLEKPWNFLGPLIIAVFVYLWFMAMKLWPLKNLRIKIYSTLFILTFLTAILTMWFVGNFLRGWISS